MKSRKKLNQILVPCVDRISRWRAVRSQGGRGIQLAGLVLIVSFLLTACWVEDLSPATKRTQKIASLVRTQSDSTPHPLRQTKASDPEATSQQTQNRNEPTENTTQPEPLTSESRQIGAPLHQSLVAFHDPIHPPALQSKDPARIQDFEHAFLLFLEKRNLTNRSLSLVYQELEGEQTRFDYNPDQRYLSASCIKVGIALTCARLVDSGLLTWDQEIPAVPDEQQFVWDETELSSLRPATSLKNLIIPMLRYSNNTSTSILFRYFLDQGRYLHYLVDDTTGTHYAKDTTLTARESMEWLKELALNPENRPSYGFVLDQLKQSTWNNFCTRDLPREICANKYGQIQGFNHEVGLVWSQHPYAYAVFSEGVSPDDLAALGKWMYDWNQGH